MKKLLKKEIKVIKKQIRKNIKNPLDNTSLWGLLCDRKDQLHDLKNRK